MSDYGLDFGIGSTAPDDGAARALTPAQSAIKILSLRLPQILSSRAPVSRDLMSGGATNREGAAFPGLVSPGLIAPRAPTSAGSGPYRAMTSDGPAGSGPNRATSSDGFDFMDWLSQFVRNGGGSRSGAPDPSFSLGSEPGAPPSDGMPGPDPASAPMRGGY